MNTNKATVYIYRDRNRDTQTVKKGNVVNWESTNFNLAYIGLKNKIETVTFFNNSLYLSASFQEHYISKLCLYT